MIARPLRRELPEHKGDCQCRSVMELRSSIVMPPQLQAFKRRGPWTCDGPGGGGASLPPPGRAEVFSGAVLLRRYERYVRHARANARGP